MSLSYSVQCFNCLSSFDAIEAVWCSCTPERPTKVCPFCLGCFCAAGEAYKEIFWKNAPEVLAEEIRILSSSRMLLGDMLVRGGAITTDQLLDALERQKRDGERLGVILTRTGALSPERLEEFLQSQHTVMPVDLARARIDTMLLRRLGVDECMKHRILPLETESFHDRQIMTLAMADPSDDQAFDRVRKATSSQIIKSVAPAEAIVSVIQSLFPKGSATLPEPARCPERSPDPIVDDDLLRRLFLLAVKQRASHVKFSRGPDGVRTHYLIDGTLCLDRARTAEQSNTAIEAITAIAQRADPGQDGKRVARAVVKLQELDYRLIIRPSPAERNGALWVKIIDPVAFPPRIEDLNMPAGAVDAARGALGWDTGLVIVSSPPLSGATCTTFALAVELVGRENALALVEPARTTAIEEVIQEEFRLDLPASLDDAITRALEAGPRTLVLTDPASIGWVRSQAALPCRMLVICRLQARSVPDALRRLVAEGYPAQAFTRHPTLVMHQRLFPKLCPSCCIRADARTARAVAGAGENSETSFMRRGPGCDACGPLRGIQGQIPIVQTLILTSEVRRALAGGSTEDLTQACRQAGLPSLRDVALEVAASGMIDPDEFTESARSAHSVTAGGSAPTSTPR
ncbi:MAG: ATPase, T2SS/T4P/T4SS family [Acidobacteriota bacterium]